jgi:hypothetical protein
MELMNIVQIYLLVVFLLVVLYVEKFKKIPRSSEQSMTLKAGETFLGVIERRRGRYIFIGHDWQRYEESLTLEEMRLIKEEFYKGYE